MPKLENIPISGLLSFQQIIEMSTVTLQEAADEVVTAHHNGLIGTSFKDTVVEEVREKHEYNTDVLNDIQKELEKRIRKMYGSKITLGSYVPRLGIKFRKEMEDFKTLLSKRKEQADGVIERHKGKGEKETPILKLDTSLSKEKIHDNK